MVMGRRDGDQPNYSRGIFGPRRSKESSSKRHARAQLSVATKKVWKDSNNEWQERTQWHQIVCFGDRMAKLAERLLEDTLVYVQGELATRDRERTINVPNGNAVIEAFVKQLEVEVKADLIRILDRRPSSDGDDTASDTEAA